MNEFGVIGFYRYVETVYKKEGKRILEVAPIVVCARAVESSGGKAKRLGVFLDIFRDSQRSRVVDWRIGDKVDKVE